MNNTTIETYNIIAKKYRQTFKNDLSESEYYDIFLEKINGKKILDVGCWIWTYTNYLAIKWFDVLWIDYSDQMLNIAKKEYPKVKFKKMDIKDFQWNEKFNGIVCANSLFHIQKNYVSNILHKFYELLKPNGKILFILLNWEWEGFQKEPFDKNLSTFVNYYSMDEFTTILDKIWFNTINKFKQKTDDKNALWTDKIIIIAKKL